MSGSGAGGDKSALAEAIVAKTFEAGAHSEDIRVERELLGVRINAKRYAIPVEHVAEIVSRPSITRVPHMPGYVWGVFNRHGHPCAVLDLAAYRGVEGEDDPRRFVVVFDPNDASLEAAIPTSEVLGIITVTDEEIDRGLGDGEESGVILGYVQRDRLIALLDTVKLLRNARFGQRDQGKE